MPKLTYESLLASKEYLLWQDLARVAKEYEITETNLFTREDLSGIYWEPFFERLYKLGQMMRFTKKLKEIRIDWMRPILYFGARSDGIIEFDGRKDIVDKGAVGDCSVVKYCFKSTINAILSVSEIDQKNFKEKHKAFKKEIKYFFNALNKYVRDGGFYKMHQHVKLILKPLLDLRRAGYRLFSVEKAEENYYDLTFFNDKDSLLRFMESTTDYFYWDKFIRSKDKDEEKLNNFMQRETDQEELKYNFRNEIRKVERPSSVNPYSTNINFYKLEQQKEKELGTNNNETGGENIYMKPQNYRNNKKISQREKEEMIRKEREKRELILPNIGDLIQPEPSKLKKEAYQVQFEKGIEEMIIYLNDKQGKDFPYMIDPHKIFVNIKCIPNGTKKEASNYYLSQLIDEIDTLKRKCYEMKLNGITRILMPITKNVEIIESLKIIFDLHNIINNTMGNYLLYDQYMFIYDSLEFLTKTNYNEQFEILKNRNFMEECVPRYVIYNFIVRSAEVLNKMRLYYKEKVGRPFKFEDSYQITQHDLMNEDNELIFAYEIYGPFINFFNDEIKTKKKKYDEEVKQFGRFWISEGFFNKEDKNLWLEAIDLLSEINVLVREDIRDYFIVGKSQETLADQDNLSSSKNSSLNSSYSGISKNRNKTAKKGKKKLNPIVKKKSLNNTDSKNKRRRHHSSRKYSGLTTSEHNKLPKDINNLRPPTVWNFPVHRIEKIIIDGSKKEIRNVDPTLCYKDGRVDKFLKLFEQIYQKTLNYFMTSSADLWDYFYSKCLKALKISYTTNKELKAEEELKRQIEEELRRQQEEEERKEEERERELERLKIRKKGEGDIQQQLAEENNKENKETNNKIEKKNEKKEEEKKIPSAKKRLSSAKPSKEISKRKVEKKPTNRMQSAKKK
jgi:hypothetical protein